MSNLGLLLKTVFCEDMKFLQNKKFLIHIWFFKKKIHCILAYYLFVRVISLPFSFNNLILFFFVLMCVLLLSTCSMYVLLYIKQPNIHIKSLFDNSTSIIIWSIFQYYVKRTMSPWKYINTWRTNTFIESMAFSACWLRSKPLSNSREQLRWSKQLI